MQREVKLTHCQDLANAACIVVIIGTHYPDMYYLFVEFDGKSNNAVNKISLLQ